MVPAGFPLKGYSMLKQSRLYRGIKPDFSTSPIVTVLFGCACASGTFELIGRLHTSTYLRLTVHVGS